MAIDIFKSWLLILYVDYLIHFRSFQRLHRIVREAPIRSASKGKLVPSADLCRAIDIACVFYFKRVLCLQRSAATTILLRSQGWNAEMVIGAQMVPFKSHAWCEIDGIVVNDRPYVTDIYTVLERC